MIGIMQGRHIGEAIAGMAEHRQRRSEEGRGAASWPLTASSLDRISPLANTTSR